MGYVKQVASLEELASGPEANARIAERIMGAHLAWHHEDIQAIVAEPTSLTSNDGRGIYCRCQGCGLHGFGNEVDWTQRCPTPPCTAYTTDLLAALTVFRTAVDQYRLGAGSFVWAGDMWIVSCGRGQYWQGYARGFDALPLAICRAAWNEYQDREEPSQDE